MPKLRKIYAAREKFKKIESNAKSKFLDEFFVFKSYVNKGEFADSVI